jgi:HEAT repeat protein
MNRNFLVFLLLAGLSTGCGGYQLDTVDGAIEVLQNSTDPGERYSAAKALGTFGSEAGWDAIAALTDALADDDTAVRVGAAYSLAATGKESVNAKKALLEALNSPELEMRIAAAYALPAVAPGDKTVLSALKAAMKDTEPRVQEEAANAIRKIELAARYK